MRPVLFPAFLLFSLLSSCERKEVKLSPIDTFTGGNKKEWLIAENYLKIAVTNDKGEITEMVEMNVTEEEECYQDDTAIFSKGEAGETKLIPVYIWKKNQKTCSTKDEDVRMYFFLSSDMKSITFSDLDSLASETDNTWIIDKVENTEIIISQTSIDTTYYKEVLPKKIEYISNSKRRLRLTYMPAASTLQN